MIVEMTNIRKFDPRLLENNKLWFKGVFSVSIYYIKYIAIKSPNCANNNEDFLNLIFNNVDGYTIKNNGIKYLVFDSTDENKKALKKYAELWEESKRQMEAINDGEPIKYRKDFMKIRFEPDDDL